MATPLCRHFGPCGGCDWQHLPYSEQLSRKRDRVRELLRASLGSRAPDVGPTIGMPVDDTGWPWSFRHKASFVFAGGGDRALTIGHYAAASRTVVPITECPVHAPRANRLAFALFDQLRRTRLPAAGPALRGVLRHLLVRTTRDESEAVVMLVVTRNEKALRTPVQKFLKGDDPPTGFFINIHDRPGPYMIGRETIRIAGRNHVRERVGGSSFLVSPTAFFQTNVTAAELIVNMVMREAGEAPRHALDLYAGSGLFSMPLAARGHPVTAVEENDQAVEDAGANARLNRVSGVRAIGGRVEDVLSRLARERFDFAVLDPPRQGCPPEVLHQLFHVVAPAKAVYVSCNPEALAAELPEIVRAGYAVRAVTPVDMFPHTTHIETVVVLEKGGWSG